MNSHIKIRTAYAKIYLYNAKQDAYLYDVSLCEIGANTSMSDKKIARLYHEFTEKRAMLADQERYSRA